MVTALPDGMPEEANSDNFQSPARTFDINFDIIGGDSREFRIEQPQSSLITDDHLHPEAIEPTPLLTRSGPY
jgi:hypothetical protein